MRLSNEGFFRRSVRAALSASAACSAFSVTGVALAQEQQPAATGEGATELEAIEVTGSRLPQPNLTSTSSMTIISDEELDYQGTINVESLLNRMPQVFAEFSTGDSNGATGTATVNLRGLGSNRTLVTIDGRRLMGGDPFLDNAPDLNFIPAALVDRIEILNDAASAVYGADAVAGVVNFMMKRDFEGFRVDSEYTQTSDSDGSSRNVTAVWGTNFARGAGNVTVYGGYVDTDQITQDSRKFSSCAIRTPASGDVHQCAGSGTIPEGRLFSYDRYYAGLDDYYLLVDPAGSRTFVSDDGRTFNFGPYNFFQRPQERKYLGAFVHREINDNVDIYADLMYMDDHTFAQIAPSGTFFNKYFVPCDSPLLSAQQRQLVCDDVGLTAADSAEVLIAKRTTEVGPRVDDLRHTQNRFVVGARGPTVEPWRYDFSFQRGEVLFSESYLNDLSSSRVQQALEGCPDDDACVPLDLFQIGAITPEQATYVRGVGTQQATLTQDIFNAYLTADLGHYGLRLPTATEGVLFAYGIEHRKESLDYRPDIAFQTGDLTGQGGESLPVKGEYNVDDLFTEVQVPLVEGAPGAKLVRFDGAYRHSTYNLSGKTDTYKAGLQYQPIGDLSLRATVQRAVRAPALTELFTPTTFGLFGFSDPCAGSSLAADPTPPSFEQCANTGVTQSQYDAGIAGAGGVADCTAGQCNATFGGNLGLAPEESDTSSFGVVYTPSYAKGLAITFDYFDISIDKAIASADPGVTVTQCLLTGDPLFCSLIHRGATGRIWGDTSSGTNFVEAPQINAGTFDTTGLDVEVDYQVNMADWGMGERGRVFFNYVTTYLDSYEAETFPGTGVYDCAGLYGVTCGTPNPYYRHKFRTTWKSVFGLTVSAQWRYFGPTRLDTSTSDPNLSTAAGQANTIDRELDPKNYLDLSGTYLLPVQGQNVTLRFGANNVTRTMPQAVSGNSPNSISNPPFGNGNTFPNVYDVSGPVYFLGLTADF